MNDTERRREALLREVIRRKREDPEARHRVLQQRVHDNVRRETNPDEIEVDDFGSVLRELLTEHDGAQQEEADFDDLVTDISAQKEDENQ